MHSIGIEEDGDILQLALLEKKGKTIKILRLYSEPKNENFVLNTSKLLKNPLITTALPPTETLFHHLSLNVKNQTQLRKAIPFHFQSICPCDVEQMLFVPTQVHQTQKKISFSLYVVDKQILRSHIKEKQKLGLSLDHTTSEMQALLRFSSFFFRKEKLIFHIHLKRLQTICLLSHEKVILGSSVIPFGWETFIDQKNEKLLQSDDLKLGITKILETKKDQLEEWKNQIKKTFFPYEKNEFNTPFALLVTGSPFGMELIRTTNILEEHSFNTLIPPTQHFSSFALSIGIAMDSLSYDKNQVQFLQQEFFQKKSKKRLLFFCSFYFLISLISFFSLSFFSSKYWNQKEKILKKNFFETLKKDSTFEIPKNIKKGLLKTSLNSVEQKNLSEFQSKYPPIFSLPRLSEILPWLQSFLSTTQGTFRMEKIHYEITQYPTLEKFLPFEAKVKLCFTCQDPELATKFNEFLLKDQQFIAQNKKILWDSKDNGLFEVEFFLKNNTKISL